ncbi:hypothetical protein F511_20078 [Dorcoceras hygrometricum]|uniref:Uncharacterized protein n=1 Tax=Dorcoceras hygrometricum TaxID=472368 RepID=A0A2Z7DHF2_9LAMI|nr:hypothetical protein F511_20078 [Dorcoceras hygrometricum]
MDQEEGKRDPPPHPPLDASGQLLAGLTRLLEQQCEAARRVRSEVVYERFRNMGSKEFSGTTDPFVVEDWIESMEMIFDVMDLRDDVTPRNPDYVEMSA